MKIRISLFFLLILLAANANAQSISWLKDFKEANQTAEATGKPILLDFTASWCKPCQEMEKTFWTRPDVIELAKKFVAVKVNFDDERSLARKYYVSAIPNVTTTDPWGNGLNFHRGFGSNSDEILENLKSIPADFSSIKQSHDQLESDKNNLAALNTLANFYYQNKFYYQSNEFNKRVLRLETDPAKRENLMINIGFNYIRSGVPDEAEDFFKDFQKEFPQSKNNESALYGLVFANVQKKKISGAEKLLAKLKTDYPQSKYIPQLENGIAKAKSEKK